MIIPRSWNSNLSSPHQNGPFWTKKTPSISSTLSLSSTKISRSSSSTTLPAALPFDLSPPPIDHDFLVSSSLIFTTCLHFFCAKFHIYKYIYWSDRKCIYASKIRIFICGNLELTVFRVISLKHFFLLLVLYMQYALINYYCYTHWVIHCCTHFNWSENTISDCV